MSAQPASTTSPTPGDAERRFLLSGVPWWTYVALRDALDREGNVRMTYLEGELELMSPSRLHEEAKKIIARLLEVWALERDIDLRGFGASTFRREAKQRGLEPDECYKLGPLAAAEVPDIAIEVTVSASQIDKMAVYARLGVPEVWTWHAEDRVVRVHRLVGERYEARDRSTFLPDLDLAHLSRHVRPGESHTQLARAYQSSLRGS